MSTSKHIDKICLAAIAVTLIITILFMNGAALGISSGERSFGYEKRLFSTDQVHTIDIVTDEWDSFLETCENEEYIAVNLTIDGEKFNNVGLRAKGNTSLSSVSAMGSQRYSFKLEFDQYQDGNSYYGLDKLCLNNLIQDNTMMKDYVVYQMMADFGVTTSLCSYVYITVNGEDWGLYLAVEGVEDSFLQRNYGSDSGELYKPDSMSMGGGRGNGQGFDMNEAMEDAGVTTEQEASEEKATADSETEGSTADAAAPDLQADSATEDSATQSTENTQGGFDFANPGGDFDFSNMPNTGGSFDFSNMPAMGDFDTANMPDMGDFDFSNMPNMGEGGFDMSNMGNMFGNMFGGMGGSDVSLKYSDDDPDSYSNIFNNAKTDITKADQERLIESLKKLTNYEDLESVLNMEEVLRYFVVHNFVVNGDSYTGTIVHNYYLHENDGQLEMIPWDYNLAFGTFMGGDASSSVNADIDNPVSTGSSDDRPMVGWIFSDEAYTEQYHALFSEFLAEWIDGGKLSALIEDTAEMLRPYVESDPTKFCTTEEFEAGVETLSEFVSLRGEAVSLQLSGDDTAVETNGLSTAAMGSMGGSMGGGGGFSFGGFGGGSNDEKSASSDGTTPETAEAGAETDAAEETGEMPGQPTAEGAADHDSGTTQPPAGAGDFSGMQMPGEGMDFSQMGDMDFSKMGDMDFSNMQPPAGVEMPATGAASENGDVQPTEAESAAETEATAEDTAADSEASAIEAASDAQQPAEGGAVDSTQRPQRENGEGGEGGMTPPGDMSIPGGTATASSTANWIWIGVSAIVLLLGLLIAIKKKY